MSNVNEPAPRKPKGRIRTTVDNSVIFMTQVGLKRFFVKSWPSDNQDEVPHQVVALAFNSQYVISLTHLTEPELKAFFEGVRFAVDVALPIVRMLDKEEQDAYERGDVPKLRFYQRMPVIALKRGLLTRDPAGIQERHGRVVWLDGEKGDTPRVDPTGLAASGETRRRVPERDQDFAEAGNRVPETDEYESLGEGAEARPVHDEVPAPEDRAEGTPPHP